MKQTENFKVIEVKEGVYLRSVMGDKSLTRCAKEAMKFEVDDRMAYKMAESWFGEVKTLVVSWEVK